LAEGLRSIVVKKNGVEVSKILVGTSPFIAAGQFEKCHQYYLEFVLRRGGAANVLSWCLKNGFTWVQAIDVDFLADEIRMASREAPQKPKIVLSTWDKPERAIRRFEGLDVRVLLLHASITDSLDPPRLEEALARIERLGLTPGVATHAPARTLPMLKRVEGVKVVMVPLNYAGLFNDRVEETLRSLREMEVVVIAKKVLGAGRLPVDEALRWAFSRPEIDSIALGVASLSEAEYTLKSARRLMSGVPIRTEAPSKNLGLAEQQDPSSAGPSGALRLKGG